MATTSDVEKILTKPNRSRRRLQLAALVAVFGLVLAACGLSDSDSFAEIGADTASDAAGDSGDAGSAPAAVALDQVSGDDDGGEEAMEQEDAIEEAEDNAADDSEVTRLGTGGSASGENVGALQPVDIGRDIIFTAQIAVEVDDVGQAANEAMNEISALGGLLFGQQTSTTGQATTTLTFRVRPADFQEAVSRLGGIGELRDQQISSEDVTGRVVDLQSQIITAEASVERLREFLKGATGLEDVARLEAQLLERETVLERLRGQLRTVKDRVDLATITVHLTERIPGPALEVIQTAYEGLDDGVGCQGDRAITVDEGDEFTVCLAIINRGDTHLTDISIRDEGFDIDTEDVFSSDDLGAVLAPGDKVEVYFPAKAKAFSTALQTGVSAAVVDADGADIGEPRVGTRGEGSLGVRQNDALPGFGDALGTGWGFFQSIIGVIVYLSGLLLPFFWVPLLAFGAFKMLRRRGDSHRPIIDEPTPEPAPSAS